MKVKLEDGTEIDAFTAEEVEAQKQAALEEFKTQNPDKTEEADALQAELVKANEALKKLQDKDLNFGNLRAQKETAEKKIDDLVKQIDDKIGAAKKEVLEGVLQDHYADILKSLSGDDEELKKKVEFQYKRLNDPTGTKDQVTKKLTDAWALATKTEAPNALNASVISSGGVSRPNITSDKKFTPEEKEFAKKMATAGGITLKDEDFK